MQIPDLVADRPQIAFIHHAAHAVGGGDGRRADLGRKADGVLKVPARILQRVGNAARNGAGIGRRNVKPRAVELLYRLGDAAVKRRRRRVLVFAAPDHKTGVIAKPLYLVADVFHEHIDIARTRPAVEPEILVDHDAVFVAVLVKRVEIARAVPRADHVEILVGVHLYRVKEVLVRPFEHCVRDAPVAALAEYLSAVDDDGEVALGVLVFELTHTESRCDGIRGGAAAYVFERQRIERLFAAAVRPPEVGILHYDGVETDFFRLPRGKRDFFCKFVLFSAAVRTDYASL